MKPKASEQEGDNRSSVQKIYDECSPEEKAAFDNSKIIRSEQEGQGENSRQIAMIWWNNLSRDVKQSYAVKYFNRNWKSLTGCEIESVYNKTPPNSWQPSGTGEQKPKLIFSPKAAQLVLKAFGKTIASNGLIVDQVTGDPVYAPNGAVLTEETFAGIVKGSDGNPIFFNKESFEGTGEEGEKEVEDNFFKKVMEHPNGSIEEWGQQYFASAGHRDEGEENNKIERAINELKKGNGHRDSEEDLTKYHKWGESMQADYQMLMLLNSKYQQTIAQQEQTIAELQAQVKMWIEECDAKREECIALTELNKKI